MNALIVLFLPILLLFTSCNRTDSMQMLKHMWKNPLSSKRTQQELQISNPSDNPSLGEGSALQQSSQGSTSDQPQAVPTTQEGEDNTGNVSQNRKRLKDGEQIVQKNTPFQALQDICWGNVVQQGGNQSGDPHVRKRSKSDSDEHTRNSLTVGEDEVFQDSQKICSAIKSVSTTFSPKNNTPVKNNDLINEIQKKIQERQARQAKEKLTVNTSLDQPPSSPVYLVPQSNKPVLFSDKEISKQSYSDVLPKNRASILTPPQKLQHPLADVIENRAKTTQPPKTPIRSQSISNGSSKRVNANTNTAQQELGDYCVPNSRPVEQLSGDKTQGRNENGTGQGKQSTPPLSSQVAPQSQSISNVLRKKLGDTHKKSDQLTEIIQKHHQEHQNVANSKGNVEVIFDGAVTVVTTTTTVVHSS